MSAPLVVLDNYSYRYPGACDDVLRDISLTLAPGSCVLLEGPTGCGKSTLLLALRGLLPLGTTQGKLNCTASVGLVLQRPATQLLYQSLGADLAFGLESRCVAPETMIGEVERALVQVGLDRPLSFPVDQLSMGQQYRACIAGQMVCDPEVMLVDEPMAQLDAQGQQHFLTLVQQWKAEGKGVLICEHQGELLRPVVDAVLHMDRQGQLVRDKINLSFVQSERGEQRQAGAGAGRLETRPIMLKLQNVGLFEEGAQSEPLDIELRQGELLAVVGPNGCGKTSLIRCLAGLRPVHKGTIFFQEETLSLSRASGKIAVVFQDPKKQLFETTVFEEIAFNGRRNRLGGNALETRIHFLLQQLGLEQYAQDSPHFLSYGQKHLVGLAAALVGSPLMLLLDDPFAGLDAASSKRVQDLIQLECQERDLAVVWTSHAPGPLTAWADQVCHLADDTGEVEDNRQQQTKRQGTWFPQQKRKAVLSSGKLLLCCTLFSCLAFAAKNPLHLALLTMVNALLVVLIVERPGRMLLKSGLMYLWQGTLVVVLYMLRFGLPEGFEAGMLMAWQLFLAFWPGLIFMKGSNATETARTIGRFLSARLAFVFAVCLRFLPTLLREMREIREMQILRGARLSLRDLRNPRFWPDWLHCLLVPTLIRTLGLADEIALAARNRNFGLLPQRTYWPGD